MAGDKDTLISMGFEAARVNWALKATSNRGLQPAMDHLIEHEGQPIPDLSSVTEASSSSGPSGGGADDEDDPELTLGGGDAEAKSIKCSQCGKVFRNTALANFHAEKSGHDQFEESTEELKPLTEEEKAQKLVELREKMAQKRAVKSVQEAEENKANEALRRKAGKDMGKIKDDMAAKAAIKEAEAKRREKIEEAKARAAIKAQIEADKKARAERAAAEKAAREGRAPPPVAEPAPVAAPRAPAASKDYAETRLQIRLASGGAPLTTTLPSDSTLNEVVQFIAAQGVGLSADTLTLTQQFPRKVFGRGELGKTLKELGLIPSAALIAS